jgi:hypothetical protein
MDPRLRGDDSVELQRFVLRMIPERLTRSGMLLMKSCRHAGPDAAEAFAVHGPLPFTGVFHENKS